MTHAQNNSMEIINRALLKHARQISEEIGATKILVYVDAIKSPQQLEALMAERDCVLAARNTSTLEDLQGMKGRENTILEVPYMDLSRASQVKVAALLALTKGLINQEDRLVCLSGSPKFDILDSMIVLDVGREFEMFTTAGSFLPDHIQRPEVFDRLFTIALELSEEGKEGKPIGTIFVLGDHEKVLELSSQLIINPFGGVPEDQKNIMDPGLKETIREFSGIDGAFVIREDGVIMAAGRQLKAYSDGMERWHGFGTRHRAAAGITEVTRAIAIAISESNGEVRVFSDGKVFIEIERRRTD